MSRPVQLQRGVRNSNMWHAVANFDASDEQACDIVMDGARLVAEADASRKFRVVTRELPHMPLMILERGVWVSPEHVV